MKIEYEFLKIDEEAVNLRLLNTKFAGAYVRLANFNIADEPGPDGNYNLDVGTSVSGVDESDKEEFDRDVLTPLIYQIVEAAAEFAKEQNDANSTAGNS